ALEYVDAAARTGENGGTVRSWLGRTSPAPRSWDTTVSAPDGDRRRRTQGRFTRNFVVQAGAAEWAMVLLASLRQRLVEVAGPLPEGAGAVFVMRDAAGLHGPRDLPHTAVRAISEAELHTRKILFRQTPVRLPLATTVTDEHSRL